MGKTMFVTAFFDDLGVVSLSGVSSFLYYRFLEDVWLKLRE